MSGGAPGIPEFATFVQTHVLKNRFSILRVTVSPPLPLPACRWQTPHWTSHASDPEVVAAAFPGGVADWSCGWEEGKKKKRGSSGESSATSGGVKATAFWLNNNDLNGLFTPTERGRHARGGGLVSARLAC